MRAELIDYIRGLSNYEYQMQCWVARECPGDIIHDELDYAIHFLFDDTALASSPEELIGVCLSNIEEANLIRNLCSSIDAFFQKYGYEKTDEEYINLPGWELIIAESSKVLKFLTQKSV